MYLFTPWGFFSGKYKFLKETRGQHGAISKGTQASTLEMAEGGVHIGVDYQSPKSLHGMEGIQKFLSLPKGDRGHGWVCWLANLSER